VRWWHEWIIDDMLLYPRDSIEVRAKRLKYSREYLNLCMHSDMFKALYEERRAAYSARLHAGIADKTAKAADLALDLVIESLDKKRDKIPFAELTEFTDRTLERLGYGASNGSSVNVQVNTAPTVTKEQLADARRDLRAVEDQRQKTIEATPLPSEPKKEG
jgi:hypothetical protein